MFCSSLCHGSLLWFVKINLSTKRQGRRDIFSFCDALKRQLKMRLFNYFLYLTIESVVRCLMDGDKPSRDFQCSAFSFYQQHSKKPTFIIIQIKIEKYLFLFNILLNCSKSYLPFSELDEIFNVSSKMILNMKLILTSKILILSFILINTK